MQLATPCVVCNQKNNNQYLDAIKRIRDYLVRAGGCSSRNNALELERAFSMGTRAKCKYGIFCQEIEHSNHEFSNTARIVSNMICDWISEGKNAADILNMCQGYFPIAYKYIERESKNRINKP